MTKETESLKSFSVIQNRSNPFVVSCLVAFTNHNIRPFFSINVAYEPKTQQNELVNITL
jgi:hypothetical protein